MTRRQLILLGVVLVMIGAAAGLLGRLRSHQRLGEPGVKTIPLAGESSDNLRREVVLPESVLDYQSTNLPIDKLVLDFLPKDTSYGQRLYRAPDGFEALVNVVMMGTDRTSIHKPQFCLTGQGWIIDDTASTAGTVHLEQPQPYELPVMKLITTKQVTVNGVPMAARGLYVYWFVCRDGVTAQHWQRMWWMAKELLRTGTVQRWAYVSCFSVCQPGQEEATFARMSRFIAASVPQFQVTRSVTQTAWKRPD